MAYGITFGIGAPGSVQTFILGGLSANPDGVPPVGGETLVAGDLTTAFDQWLDAEGAGDRNTLIATSLRTHYNDADGDLTTLLARFLKERS